MMDRFSDTIMALCSSYGITNPVISEQSAAIELDELSVSIQNNSGRIHFSALIGALPAHGHQREEATQKILQGSLSILRTHSIVIKSINRSGRDFIQTSITMHNSSANLQELKTNLDEFHVVSLAVREILAKGTSKPSHQVTNINLDENNDEIEFVFKA